MRSVYITVALLFSSAYGVHIPRANDPTLDCEYQSVDCNSEFDCNTKVSNFACPAGTTLNTNPEEYCKIAMSGKTYLAALCSCCKPK
ncbi:hypothetical protein BUE80_DR006612 [Diplocarpon rosae]|nr:hypothetical protein BUE80_DR006612 [Diplocarpon rosae]